MWCGVVAGLCGVEWCSSVDYMGLVGYVNPYAGFHHKGAPLTGEDFLFYFSLEITEIDSFSLVTS